MNRWSGNSLMLEKVVIDINSLELEEEEKGNLYEYLLDNRMKAQEETKNDFSKKRFSIFESGEQFTRSFSEFDNKGWYDIILQVNTKLTSVDRMDYLMTKKEA